MSQYVKTFEERHPGANVRLEYLHPSRVRRASDQWRGGAGFAVVPTKWPDLNVITWREEGMVLAVHPSHRVRRAIERRGRRAGRRAVRRV